MFSSKDEIINLVDYPPPSAQPPSWKRPNNKIDSPSPSIASPSPSQDASKSSDISNMFAVKQKPAGKLPPLQSGVDDVESIVSTSEMSDEVFETPRHKQGKSYKDKIRERFNSVKNSTKNVRQTRILDRVRRESQNLDLEVKTVRSKLQRNDNRSVVEFFTGEKSVTVEPETERVVIEEQPASPTDVFYARPKVLSSGGELFYLDSKPVEVDEKTHGEEPRHLAEEGLFVSDLQHIPKHHKNLIEKRLVTSQDKRWFDCQGDLNLLPNPLVNRSIRPEMPHYDAQTIYSQPTLLEDCEEILVVHENILELHLASLKFTHHPLFSPEHALAEKLRNLYETHEKISENHLKKVYNQLRALRHVKKNLETLRDTTRVKACAEEIKQLRERWLEQGRNHRENLKAILEAWKRLKSIRESNKFSSTKLKLIIRKSVEDLEVYREQYQEDFRMTFEEVQEDDPDVEEADLRKRFQASLRPPGEPKIKLFLNFENELTENPDSTRECTRRSAVRATKLYLRILCNGLEVCKSHHVPLLDDFSCNFDESFSILLTNIPRELTVELLEQPNKALLKRKLCEIHLGIPSQLRQPSKELQMEAFDKPGDVLRYKHDGIGSGATLKQILEPFGIAGDEQQLYTRGFLQYQLQWDRVVENNDLVHQRMLDDVLEKTGGLNQGKLKEWMSENTLDPQDPKNCVLFEFSSEEQQHLALGYLKEQGYFRLDPYSKPWQFCPIAEIQNNLRLKILQLRNQNEIEFDGMVVPNRIKEIPFGILADYKRRLTMENEAYYLDILEDGTNPEIVGANGRKFLKQAYVKVFQTCKSGQNNLCYEDVVDEKYLAFFQLMLKTMLRNLGNWFRFQPKIMLPLPVFSGKSLESSRLELSTSQLVKVVLRIVGARNVPQRKSGEIQPFVQVDFSGVSGRTTSGKGANPVWNQTLTLPLQSQHTDYLNPNSLQGVIGVHLFDQYEEQAASWLGMVEVPFAAICNAQTMEGSFKLRMPQLLLGYQSELEKSSANTPRTSSVNLAHAPSIQMEIRIEPNVPKLTPCMEELPASDSPYIHEHILKWNEVYNANFPQRKFSALAIKIDAKTTCVTRFVRPLEPPQISAEEYDVTPEQCLRYISLIPFTDCSQFYQNVWLTTDQLLRLKCGSVVDHAVALTCFLLALKLDVWLLLGYGVPHGTTAYVLMREYIRENELPTFWVYDVVYNEKYNVLDALCPLQKIYCLINEENVWGNTQRTDTVSLTRFDLTRSGDWLPLFNTRVHPPVNPLNTDLDYLDKFPHLEDFELFLERKLKKRFSKWRKFERTVWNLKISHLFKNALRQFEVNAMFGKNNQEIVGDLNKGLLGYDVKGHVVNMPFVSVSGLVKKIQALEVHVWSGVNVEFALGVYLHSYGGQMLSCWIFIAHCLK